MQQFTAPDGTKYGPNDQGQIGNQKWPAGWLAQQSAPILAALGITVTTVADPSPAPTTSGVVFLGDSITAFGDTAPDSWATRLNNFAPFANAGVPSDTTGGMLNRLPPYLLTKPKAVFLLGGVNDLQQGIASAVTISNIQAIAALCRSVGATLFTQAVTPVVPPCVTVNNTAILALNAALKPVVNAMPNGQWLDWSTLWVASDYKSDGIHPSTSGYTKWASILLPLLALYRS